MTVLSLDDDDDDDDDIDYDDDDGDDGGASDGDAGVDDDCAADDDDDDDERTTRVMITLATMVWPYNFPALVLVRFLCLCCLPTGLDCRVCDCFYSFYSVFDNIHRHNYRRYCNCCYRLVLVVMLCTMPSPSRFAAVPTPSAVVSG